MNNQKDIQKTSINERGQFNVPDVKSLANIGVYEFANKKTEKLVTALYMVSDCMDSDNALKGKLRQLGVELLSDMYKLSNLSPMDKHIHISSSLARVNEILSFVEIAYTIGFISEMNTAILKKEFIILIGELESYQKKDKHFIFTLDEQMFSTPEIPSVRQGLAQVKRTPFNSMSFSSVSSVTNLADRKNRTDKILNLIKDLSRNKADLSRNKAEKKEISIKDISNSFTNCSEKTIQRELNSLVSKGKIKKTGAKRWSRYQLVSSN